MNLPSPRIAVLAASMLAVGLAGCSQYVKKDDFSAAIQQLQQIVPGLDTVQARIAAATEGKPADDAKRIAAGIRTIAAANGIPPRLTKQYGQ